MRSLIIALLCVVCFNLNSQNVYVCTGDDAVAYHNINTCSGLRNCKASILAVTEYDAINIYDRRPCCLCWYPQRWDCKNDNQGASTMNNVGYVDPTAAGVVAVAIVATGLFLESHELYVHRTMSGYKKAYWITGLTVTDVYKSEGGGWNIGLRRNFSMSSLEYGYSRTKYHVAWNVYLGSGHYTEARGYTILQYAYIDWVRHLYFSNLNEAIIPFIGIGVNEAWYAGRSKGGIGFIVGTQIKFGERAALDARYCLFTQYRGFELGLNFIYQHRTVLQRRKDKRNAYRAPD